MSTTEERLPMNISINGSGVVSSSEGYTVDQAADVQRMIVEVVNRIVDFRRGDRATAGALLIVEDVTPSRTEQHRTG